MLACSYCTETQTRRPLNTSEAAPLLRFKQLSLPTVFCQLEILLFIRLLLWYVTLQGGYTNKGFLQLNLFVVGLPGLAEDSSGSFVYVWEWGQYTSRALSFSSTPLRYFTQTLFVSDRVKWRVFGLLITLPLSVTADILTHISASADQTLTTPPSQLIKNALWALCKKKWDQPELLAEIKTWTFPTTKNDYGLFVSLENQKVAVLFMLYPASIVPIE